MTDAPEKIPGQQHESADPPMPPEHLGDGAYASFDGWYLWLGANHPSSQLVALDGQQGVQALVDYARRCGMVIA